MLNLPISALLMSQGPLFCPWRRGGRACGGGRRRQCRSGQGGRHVARARPPAAEWKSTRSGRGARGARAHKGGGRGAGEPPRHGPTRGDGLCPAAEEVPPPPEVLSSAAARGLMQHRGAMSRRPQPRVYLPHHPPTPRRRFFYRKTQSGHRTAPQRSARPLLRSDRYPSWDAAASLRAPPGHPRAGLGTQHGSAPRSPSPLPRAVRRVCPGLPSRWSARLCAVLLARIKKINKSSATERQRSEKRREPEINKGGVRSLGKAVGAEGTEGQRSRSGEARGAGCGVAHGLTAPRGAAALQAGMHRVIARGAAHALPPSRRSRHRPPLCPTDPLPPHGLRAGRGTGRPQRGGGCVPRPALGREGGESRDGARPSVEPVLSAVTHAVLRTGAACTCVSPGPGLPPGVSSGRQEGIAASGWRWSVG